MFVGIKIYEKCYELTNGNKRYPSTSIKRGSLSHNMIMVYLLLKNKQKYP